MKKELTIKSMAKIGVLSAIAGILMLIEFPLWFAPGFYKLDLSEVVVLVGGFAIGPYAAIFIELIKILINFIANGTSTAGIGELANFIMGVVFVLPAAIIYKKKKTLKSAIIGMLIGTAALTIIGAIINLYVMLPVYSAAYGLPLDAIIAMGHSVNPAINDINGLVLLATTPFNLLKGVLSSLITVLIYKYISPILHK